MHCSIATVDQHLQPTITPIGTLFLHEQGYSGFFFDAYSGALEENLAANADDNRVSRQRQFSNRHAGNL